jgi:hypothetical protein
MSDRRPNPRRFQVESTGRRSITDTADIQAMSRCDRVEDAMTEDFGQDMKFPAATLRPGTGRHIQSPSTMRGYLNNSDARDRSNSVQQGLAAGCHQVLGDIMFNGRFGNSLRISNQVNDANTPSQCERTSFWSVQSKVAGSWRIYSKSPPYMSAKDAIPFIHSQSYGTWVYLLPLQHLSILERHKSYNNIHPPFHPTSKPFHLISQLHRPQPPSSSH